jgi:hypothetical protein
VSVAYAAVEVKTDGCPTLTVKPFESLDITVPVLVAVFEVNRTVAPTNVPHTARATIMATNGENFNSFVVINPPPSS